MWIAFDKLTNHPNVVTADSKQASKLDTSTQTIVQVADTDATQVTIAGVTETLPNQLWAYPGAFSLDSTGAITWDAGYQPPVV